MLQRIEGRANHVVRVRRADRLRDHVLDAERLEHGAHRAAGDDAGTGRSSAQVDTARAMTAGDVVMQRTALAQRHAGQVALGGFGGLADRLRHFARLAVTEAGAALLVADHDQRCETEALAALDDLGHAIDVDELVDELAVALLPAFTCRRRVDRVHHVVRVLPCFPILQRLAPQSSNSVRSSARSHAPRRPEP